MPLYKNNFKYPPRKKFNVFKIQRCSQSNQEVPHWYLSLGAKTKRSQACNSPIYFSWSIGKFRRNEETLQVDHILQTQLNCGVPEARRLHVGECVQQPHLLTALFLFILFIEAFFFQSLNGDNTGNTCTKRATTSHQCF